MDRERLERLARQLLRLKASAHEHKHLITEEDVNRANDLGVNPEQKTSAREADFLKTWEITWYLERDLGGWRTDVDQVLLPERLKVIGRQLMRYYKNKGLVGSDVENDTIFATQLEAYPETKATED